MNEICDIEYVKIAISSLAGHGEHQASCVQGVCNKPTGSTIKTEGVEDRKEPAKHHLETGDSSMDLRHDEDKTFSGGLRGRMDGDATFQLDQC